ncbi:MAG: hypothetical protein FWD63_06730, partial [Propionibacteriaceae bacterium]|nr:hypothetical protein [Propionibacteriaceae bacterium]
MTALAMLILGLGGVLLVGAPAASAASTTGTYPVTGWFTDDAGVGASPAVTGARLANGLKAPMIELNDNLLLGSGNYVSVTNGWIGYYSNDGTAPVNSKATLISAGNGGRHTSADSAGGQFLSTLALDANNNGHGDGKPYVYSWPWDGNNSQNNTSMAALNELMGQTLPLGTLDGTKTTGRYFQSIYRWTSGQTIPDVSVLPTANYFEPSLSQANNYWSGGEVMQRTGQIFLGGAECSALDASFRMMVWDPADGSYNYSGKILPATPADDLFAGGNACMGQGYVASDMSLDALGNAYILVQSRQPSETFDLKRTVLRNWLVRVVPSKTGNWKYSLVQPLIVAPGEPASSSAFGWAGNGTAGSGQNMTYGAAFFKGAMYASSNAFTSVVKIDPMSGTVTSLPAKSVYSGDPSYVQDMASADTVAVIQGTVYNDVTGSGKVDGAKGVGGVKVALYYLNADSKWVYAGSHNTNAVGDYVFLTAGLGTYAVRLVQPAIGTFDSSLDAYTQTDPVNAWQTYASAGVFPGIDPNSGADTVTPNCAGNAVNVSGACAGNLTAPVVDPPVPDLSLAGVDTTLQLDAIPIVSTVVIGTDQAVAEANFGITASGSYGDAAAGPATIAANAPVHVNAANPQVYLGAQAGVYPGPAIDNKAHDATDDGLYIGGSALLGNVQIGPALVLAGGRTYDLKATVSGPRAADALVNAWTTTAGGANWKPTAVWTPTVASGLASGTFTPATGASSGIQQLRAQVTLGTLPTLPNNSGHEYQELAGGNVQPWTTPGEIEDYQYNVAPAVYRPA